MLLWVLERLAASRLLSLLQWPGHCPVDRSFYICSIPMHAPSSTTRT